ncbi:DUF4268 domain-containing protein [Fulvivirga lutea]|uniref:DUF4268 domain-containing protein n=1 Tax=Fulvivirga lutea TaxID=2810512 RepID=A0A974WGR1_9BACT|nr:DUF4268 domain-containing protein [Fulvivirga lutea]QSE97564.1 DUF4268 domain-containing protein [Fulvivirga lutea]
MYSKEESAVIRKKFWTALGRHLSSKPSAEGLKVNWLNYKTGVKHLFFRMDIIKKEAYIGIELHHPDEGIRELFFEQFLELKTYLHSILEEEWIWDEEYYQEDSNKYISRIFTSKKGLTIFNQEHWPELINFLAPRMRKLDEFWSDAKYSFDALK